MSGFKVRPKLVIIVSDGHRESGRQVGEHWRPEGRKHESRDPALGAGFNPHGNRTRWVSSSGIETAGWVGSQSSSRGGGSA